MGNDYKVASGEYNDNTDTNAGPDAVSGTIANAPVDPNDEAGGKSD